jgi:endonuclease/exonuclease/phosphatase family metal-dependent hydrolase
MAGLRVMTWNILHGGGRDRMPRLLMAILGLRPDIVVVTEARRRFAGQLAGGLADAGLGHALLPEAPDGVNGVLVVSRFALTRAERPGLPACLEHRWAEAEIPELGVSLIGVHLPEAGRQPAHGESWRALVQAARERREHRCIIAGDLNTWRDGPGSRERSGAQATNLGRLAALGYVDAWSVARAEAPGITWTGGRGEAFRLDYVVVSGPLGAALVGARVAHADRAERLSDHGAVVVDLALGC